jgi:hypothetical protein
MGESGVKVLPDDMHKLTRLKVFSIQKCTAISIIPSSIVKIKALKSVHARGVAALSMSSRTVLEKLKGNGVSVSWD